jgi:uncharacterized protein (TIGR02452 family)
MEEEYPIKDRRRYDKYQRGYKKSKPTPKVKNNHLTRVWDDTCIYFQGYKVKRPYLIDITELENKYKPIDMKPIMEVKNIDTFDMAIEYEDFGMKPLVLNMASDKKAGGGVRSGSMAQEEELFRRSSAFLSHPDEWYPLNEHEVIYSPEVIIMKNTQYNLIAERSVGMIACAAVRHPRLIHGKYKEEDYKEMRAKIESIFLIGIEKMHDSLVLGALGCGAFGNPPKDVALIFKEMVDRYGGYFKKIGFAVLTVKDRDNENLTTFQEVFNIKGSSPH